MKASFGKYYIIMMWELIMYRTKGSDQRAGRYTEDMSNIL